MKRKKVLLGLFAGLLALAGGSASAQTGKFYEMGPANIGGDVTSLVLDQRDTSRHTLFAGTPTGGVYVRSDNSELLRALYSEAEAELASNVQIWHYVRYVREGREVVLPVSCIAQIPNENKLILVGTGSDNYRQGSTIGQMSMVGKGIYFLNPYNYEYTLIPGTDSDTNFAVVHGIDLVAYENANHVSSVAIYVSTATGLFRWITPMTSVTSITAASAQKLFTGNVEDVELVKNFMTGYFTCGSQLYKIGNIVGAEATPVNISASNIAFAGADRNIRIAVAPSDSRYLYAMVFANGNMENLYLTTDGQNWTTLTTPTVTPLTRSTLTNGATLTVDPGNPKRVYIAGTNIWAGEGFVEGSFYQWTKVSNSEYEYYTSSGQLTGNYMGTIFGNYDFVHSGVHQIIPAYTYVSDNDGHNYAYNNYYIASQGGVYSSYEMQSFQDLNRGLNASQINDVAVCPDGSIISAASNNGCPFIESRSSRNATQSPVTWYNDGSISNINQDANILWKGSGARVAASSFQQLFPQSRRNIFTTSMNGTMGRAYADYFDYTNTNTWTADTSLLTNRIAGGPLAVLGQGDVALWETSTNTRFNSMVRVGVDTLGYVLRPNGNGVDTLWVNDASNGANRGSKFQMKAGDTVLFNSRANSDYAFKYGYTRNGLTAGDSLTVVNPIQSRMLMVGKMNDTIAGVFFCWTPNDFTKVWSTTDYASGYRNKIIFWAPVMLINRTGSNPNDVERSTVYPKVYFMTGAKVAPRAVAFSNDARFAYISVYDQNSHRSQLYRVKGFENIDFSKSQDSIFRMLNYKEPENPLYAEPFTVNGKTWFDRPISSIAVDPNQDRLILTFDDFCDSVGNIAYVNSPSTSLNQVTFGSVAGNNSLPVYCALVEKTHGNVFVGTDKGVYEYANGSWNVYDKIGELPVTSIYQQTSERPIMRNLSHTGVTANNFVFSKTKWPYALYFGTYGRGIFMDMTYVTDTANNVCDPEDYNHVDIPVVNSIGVNSINLYPNPVSTVAHVGLTAAAAGNAEMRVYDLNGRAVLVRSLGMVTEGEHTFTLDTQDMAKGMYLVNITVGRHTASAKMMVR